jgi:hypothetical protein
MALPPAVPFTGSAIVTAVTDRSVVPNALDRRRRKISAPSEMRIVWRIVELEKTRFV